MPATTSTTREERWLRTRLNTVGLPVYTPEAPETAAFPCTIFRLLSSVDIVNLYGTYMVRSIWLVFISNKGPFQPESQQAVNAIEPYSDAMHAAIYKPPGTVVSGRLIEECRREYEYRDSPIENGTRYLQIGGAYRVLTTLA